MNAPPRPAPPRSPRVSPLHCRCALFQASPDWKPPANRVVDLSSDTFDDFVNEEKLSLVYFFAP